MEYFENGNDMHMPPRESVQTGRPGSKICGSIFMSFFLWVFLITLVGVIIANTVLKSNMIERILKKVDYSELTMDIISADTSNNTSSGNIENVKDDSESVSDFLYKEFKDINPDYDISRENFDKFVDTDLAPYISEVLGDAADAVLNGKGEINVSADDIVEIIKNSEVEEIRDIDISDEDIKVIDDALEEYNVKDAVEKLNNGTVTEVYRFTKYFMSGFVIGIVVFIVMLFVLGIVLVNRKFIKAVFLHIGIPVFLAGLVFTGGSVTAVNPSFVRMININSNLETVVNACQRTLSSTLFIISGVLLVLGLIFTVVGCIVKNKPQTA